MGYIRLEWIEPKTNKYRFYLVTCTPTLWKTWAVWREWGRIGEDARGMQMSEFCNEDEALYLASRIIELRLKHGYRVKAALLPTKRSLDLASAAYNQIAV